MDLKLPESIIHLQDEILPPKAMTFRAFDICAVEQITTILFGQDPFYRKGVANGLAFSVNKGQKLPGSLKNIFKELVDDIHCQYPPHGDLTKWAEQGVLLVNTALSVLEGSPGIHAKHWKSFTESWVRKLGQGEKPLVWILWGDHAKKFEHLIAPHHRIVSSVHPSPLSAYRGFFGSKPFSSVNHHLKSLGYKEIDWEIK